MKRTIVALDPGGTTGWVAWHNWETVYGYGELKSGGGWEHHVGVWKLLDEWRYKHVLATRQHEQRFDVVCERFEFRHEERNRDKIEYISAEYIGVVKAWTELVNHHQGTPPSVHLEMQSSAQAKGFWDNDKLKRVGAYRTGMPHARDAMRHMLYYRAFTLGDQELLAKLRLPRKGDIYPAM